MDVGKTSEDWIERICCETFFSDFTIRSPKYVKANGHEKELADILVPFGDTLLVFQVKAHLLDASKPELSLERALRKVAEAGKQFRSVLDALHCAQRIEAITSRGLAMSIDLKSFKTFFFIRLLDIHDDENIPYQFVGLGEDETPSLPIAIMTFFRYEFDSILQDLTTISDFIAFLVGMRVFRIQQPEIAKEWAVLDFLAFLRMHPRLFRSWIEEERRPQPIPAGALWSKYESKWMARRLQRVVSDVESAHIDEIIDYLHRAVDFTVEHDANRISIPPGTVDRYRMAAQKLARFSRDERGVIARILMKKRKQGTVQPISYQAVVLGEGTIAVLIVVSRSSREDRIREAGGLGLLFAAEISVLEVICIATEPDDFSGRSYDVTVIPEAELKAARTRGIASAPLPMFSMPEGFRKPRGFWSSQPLDEDF